MHKPTYFVARVLRIGKLLNYVIVCDESPVFASFVVARNWLRGHRAPGMRIIRESATQLNVYEGY